MAATLFASLSVQWCPRRRRAAAGFPASCRTPPMREWISRLLQAVRAARAVWTTPATATCLGCAKEELPDVLQRGGRPGLPSLLNAATQISRAVQQKLRMTCWTR